MKKKEKAVILIVDDRPANILALENLLAEKDRVILKALSGTEALRTVMNTKIDLIVLDVQMPEMDGFEVAAILKSNRRTSDIPIIFASAEKKDHQFMMKGFEEGAIDYLFKPLNPAVAKAKVAVLLRLQLQKKELQEKNASLQKSALLIDNSADIIGILDAETFKIEEINNAFTTILGYPKEEARGTAFPFYMGNEHESFFQDIRKKSRDHLSFETAVHSKNRSIKWLQWKVVVKDKKWFVNARDITEIKLVEKIRDYLAAVVKQSNDAIYIHDHEGKIISWNNGAKKMYGYTEKEALKMKVWNIIPGYLRPEADDLIARIIQGSKIHDVETKRVTRHGKLLDVSFSASLLANGNKDQSTIVITERDVTQQKIAGEEIRKLNANLHEKVMQLEASNKEMEAFSYSISHDLRAPLRALSGYSSMLEEDHANALDPEAGRLITNIKSNAKRMSTLIDDLLAFSKIGKKELNRSKVNMEGLVESVLYEAQKNYAHSVKVICHAVPPAYCDQALLYQVWMNLLSNALKYSSKKSEPQIEIGSESGAETIRYYVKDNGAGFNMQYAHKLFGVFQRLHTDHEFEGTGVGLAIVQRIVVKHGGRVWAESEEGVGSTFYFTLPALENG